MSDSRNSSRKNTENDSSIEVVQIDGLVIMKLIKHCHELEASTSGSGIAQGALLGKNNSFKTKNKFYVLISQVLLLTPGLKSLTASHSQVAQMRPLMMRISS